MKTLCTRLSTVPLLTMVCTVFNPTLEIARQEVQEVATDDVVLEKVEDAFEHFSIKYNFFNILLFHGYTWLHIVYQHFV